MTTAPAIANARRPGQPMSDEQRRAMWANIRGGGNRTAPTSTSALPGGVAGPGESTSGISWKPVPEEPAASSGTQTRTPFIPPPVSKWDLFKAGVSGFWEGAKGGATILADRLTFGAIDSLSDAAEQYQGADYDFSRGASTVAREALLAAAGIGAAGKLKAAFQGTKYAGTAAAKHLSALSAVGGFGTKSVLDDIRENNPTLNPYADKAFALASQLAGYVGSIGLIGAAGQYGGALMRSTGLAGIGKAALGKLDAALGTVGKAIAAPLPSGMKSALGKLHKAYSGFSDFTGSSIKELGAALKAPANLAKARALSAKAASAATKANVVKFTASQKAAALRQASKKAFEASLKASGTPQGAKLYKEAVNLSWQASETIARGVRAAAALTKAAGKLTLKADALKTATTAGLRKAAYVAGMIGGVEARDELAIREYQRQARQAGREGMPFDIPQDAARSAAGTLGAFAIGTTGNPVEKLFRPGLAAHQASIGAYRAGYEAIQEEAKREGWTDAKLQRELAKHAKTKPRDIAGKGLWQVAPAAAAFVNWKAGDAIARAKRSTIDVRGADGYADADTLRLTGSTVRMLDMNAPEVAHPGHNQPGHPERTTGEYLGDAAARRIAELVKPNQYVRIVQDSNPKAREPDKYGRTMAVVETLPKPFDQLLRIPYLGKIIPARDVNKTLIREGLADIHYRELSGRTDRAEAYDKAREKAKAEGKGIWSQYAQEEYDRYAKTTPGFKPWIGTEKTVAERQSAEYLKKTGRIRPDSEWADVASRAGIGLMASGNSGLFGMLPKAGTLTAQTWNAALAALGALEYNERAERTIPRSTPPPASVKTDYAREMAALQRVWAQRIADLNAAP